MTLRRHYLVAVLLACTSASASAQFGEMANNYINLGADLLRASTFAG